MIDFYAELTQYTGRDRRLVEERCKTAAVELAYLWEKMKTDPIAYYRDSDLYLFDLSHYQTLLQQNGFHNLLMHLLTKYGCKSILDYGGGIGQYTILAMQGGMTADFLEVEGSATMKYAQWRFDKYGLKPGLLTEQSDLTGVTSPITPKIYDCIVAMDVFEHIENPQPIIERLSKITKYIWANPEEIPYNYMYPQHISRFDLSPYFKNVERYLWERL